MIMVVSDEIYRGDCTILCQEGAPKVTFVYLKNAGQAA